jgi:hypothetical protein
MKRPLLVLCAAAATLFAASAAQASRVSWSIGINVPPVASYVSSGPAWAPAPVYARPAPVYGGYAAPVYAPAPVVYDEPYVETYVVPPVGYFAPPVLLAPRHRYWAPRSHWAPPVRARWDRHDRWHH